MPEKEVTYMTENIPRVPTEEERAELIAYKAKISYRNPTKDDLEQEKDFVENASIAVFDNYITDGPGYAGKVMIVIWSGDPSFTETYTWDRMYANGKVNIPIHDTHSSEEGNYTTKLHQVKIEVFSEE